MTLQLGGASSAWYCSVTAVSPFTPPSTRCDCSFIQMNCVFLFFFASFVSLRVKKDGKKTKERNSNPLLLDTVRNIGKRIKK